MLFLVFTTGSLDFAIFFLFVLLLLCSAFGCVFIFTTSGDLPHLNVAVKIMHAELSHTDFQVSQSNFSVNCLFIIITAVMQ